MASFETLRQLELHPEWIPPRSDVRVFLGEPGAPEATKTTVEPGNAFSPGMLTFGVTWWIRFPATGKFFTPETAPLDELRWSYMQGYLPAILCHVNIGELRVRHTLFQDGTACQFSEAVAARIELEPAGDRPVDAQLFLVLRSLGPAGGPLYDIQYDRNQSSLWEEHWCRPLMAVDREPAGAGCGVGDPSALACLGNVPAETEANDPAGWCYGLLRYDLHLTPDTVWAVTLDCPQRTCGTLAKELHEAQMPRPEAFEQRLAAHLNNWRLRFSGIDLDVPDPDFQNAFFAGLQHILTAVTGDQARIAPLFYPLPWLRDSIFMIRCLDLAGFHDLARAATGYVSRHDFFGGFGAEGDAPGQGLWALVQHYRLTRDRDWLKEVYPSILRKVDWLKRMRQAQQSIRVCADTPVLAFTHAQRASGIICLPARDGIIQGTMDHGVQHALGWVNHWAICGLREAAYAAQQLGQPREVRACLNEANDLQEALVRYARANPAFFEQARSVNSLLWPTWAWSNDLDEARSGFDAWYQRHREPAGKFQPEPYWLYFEFAQAHNALLFGQRQRAWQVVDYRLHHQDLPGLYGFREGGQGVGTKNATQGATLIPMLRGCQKVDSITPHGWSQAEFWLLQRALLLEEWADGLLLFAGVPEAWLQPNARIAFRNWPSAFGLISARLQMDLFGLTARIEVSGPARNTPLTLRLPGEEIQTLMPRQALVTQCKVR